MNRAKLRSTLGFLVAYLVAYGPELVTWIGSMQTAPQWLRDVAKGLGVFIGVLTSKEGVLLVNKLVPVPDIQSSQKTPGIRPTGRIGTGGHATPAVFFLVAFIALALFTAIVAAAPAHAQERPPQAIGCVDTLNTYCVVPAAAVGWQLNLKTGNAQNGVALVGLAMQHEIGSLPLALGLYGGLGASEDAHTSYQGCIGVSVTNFGLVCVGAQRATLNDGTAVYQGMLTLAGQLTFGGSPSYVRAIQQASTIPKWE
jgi:hypothetical protein